MPVYSVDAHAPHIVNAIDGCAGPGPREIATGGRDGVVRVWDVRQKDKPVALLEPAVASGDRDRTSRDDQPRPDCWTVAFGDAHNALDRCVVAGFDNGDLRLFDLRTLSERWATRMPRGVCCARFDATASPMNRLLVTMLEGRIAVFDMLAQHPTAGYAFATAQATHGGTVWTGAIMPHNNRIIATGSGSGSLDLWAMCAVTAASRRAAIHAALTRRMRAHHAARIRESDRRRWQMVS